MGIIPSTLLLFYNTSDHCGINIHISLCFCSPEGEGRSCWYFSFFACFPGSVCFGLMVHLKVTAPKGVLHTPLGLKIDLAGFLRHRRRILASAPSAASSSPHTPTSLTSLLTLLILHGTILASGTCLVT